MVLWSPENIRTEFWLDANDSSTITVSGSQVTSWLDKSANTRTVIQDNLSACPIKTTNSGKDCIYFDGASSFMYRDSFLYDLGACTVFLVGNFSEVADRRIISEGSSVSDNPLYCIAQSGNTYYDVESSDKIASYLRDDFLDLIITPSSLSNDIAFDDTDHVFAWEDSGSSLYGYVDFIQGTGGRTYTRPLSFTVDKFSIGAVLRSTATAFSTGYIYEIVILENPISDNVRTYMEGYLAWKWGLETKLPTNHLFYSNAPKYFQPESEILWNPENVTSRLWLDANDSDTITIETGVSEWRDKSGNSNHFTQATSSYQPALVENSINGLNSIKPDGSNDLLCALTPDYLLSGNPMCIFAVFINDSTGSTYSQSFAIGTRISYGGINNVNSGWMFRVNTSDFLYGGVGTGSGSIISEEVLEEDETYLISAEVEADFSDGVLRLFGNESVLATDALSAGAVEYDNGYMAIGKSGAGYLTANICEIIIASSVTAEDRYKIEGYLAWKWGLESELALTHPYTLNAPITSYMQVDYAYPKDGVKLYGKDQNLTLSISTLLPARTYDVTFYSYDGSFVSTTLSGIDVGSPATALVTTDSGVEYNWYAAIYLQEFDNLSNTDTYAFYVRYLCSGIVEDSLTGVSGVTINLHRRSTGELVDSTTLAGSLGNFTLDTQYNEDHYVVALHPSSKNAEIFDKVAP